MQAVAETHETPLSTPLAGLGWIDHLVPSQRSTSGALSAYPTAVHAVGDVHDTPSRLSRKMLFWVVRQVEPVKASASPSTPTATHAVGEVHETELSSSPRSP